MAPAWGPPAPLRARLTRALASLLFQNEISHDERCTACKLGADLQPCGTCPGAYHLSCLDPPLKAAPKGVWVCPKCQQKVGGLGYLGGALPSPCTRALAHTPKATPTLCL